MNIMTRKNRRNFLPTFIVSALLWLALAFIVFRTSPDDQINIVLFFVTLVLALALTLALLFGNSRRGFLGSLLLAGFLLLRLISLANWLNIILLSAAFGALELSLSISQKRQSQ
jgi:hypothetical protein